MNSKPTLLFLAAIFWVVTVNSQKTSTTAMKLGRTEYSDSQKLDYLVSLPDNYENATKVPMLLFLHGGDRSNTRHHPKKYAVRNNIEFPFLVIAPNCKSGCSWSSINYDGFLKELVETYKIDSNRIYLTGYSMGGYGAWQVLENHSQWFAAAAPIAGGGNPDKICKAKDVAIRAYHGEMDEVVSSQKSRLMIDALKKCGGNADLILYPKTDHGSWIKTYQDPAFYSWLLKHMK